MMNIYRYTIILLATFLLTGCSESLSEQDDVIDVRFSMSAQPDTRAGEDEPLPSRYIVEIYRHKDATSQFIEHKEYSTPDFTIRLAKGEYDFYFWADRGSAYYNASSLSAVKVIPVNMSLDRVCYSNKLKNHVVSESFPPMNVTLRRPIARVNYINTGVVPTSGTQTRFSYTAPEGYNVITEQPLNSVAYDLSSEYNADASFFAVDYIFPTESERVDINATVGSKTTLLKSIAIGINKQTNISAIFNN